MGDAERDPLAKGIATSVESKHWQGGRRKAYWKAKKSRPRSHHNLPSKPGVAKPTGRLRHPDTAIGAGEDYALASLHLGHTAKEAVETACELSVYCERPVKSLTRRLKRAPAVKSETVVKG